MESNSDKSTQLTGLNLTLTSESQENQTTCHVIN